jgi:hypothetical protein
MTLKEVLGKVLGRPQEVFLAPREYILRLGMWFGAKKSNFADSICKVAPIPIGAGFKYGELTK